MNLAVSGVAGALSGLSGKLVAREALSEAAQSSATQAGIGLKGSIIKEVKDLASDKAKDSSKNLLIESLTKSDDPSKNREDSAIFAARNSVDEIVNWEKSNNLGVVGSGSQPDLVQSLQMGRLVGDFRKSLYDNLVFSPSCQRTDNPAMMLYNQVQIHADQLEKFGIGGTGNQNPVGINALVNRMKDLDATLQRVCWSEQNKTINSGPMKSGDQLTDNQAIAKTLVNSVKVETECLNRRLLVAAMQEYIYAETLLGLESFCENAIKQADNCQPEAFVDEDSKNSGDASTSKENDASTIGPHQQ